MKIGNIIPAIFAKQDSSDNIGATLWYFLQKCTATKVIGTQNIASPMPDIVALICREILSL